MDSSQDDSQQAPDLGRRQVLAYLLGLSVVTTLVGVFTPIIGYLIPPTEGSAGSSGRVLVGTTEDIPLSQGKVVSMGSKAVIVSHTDQGVKAFSAVCTHLGCICSWDEARQLILCPCHDGQFNAVTGAVMSGPPPAPLPSIPVSMDGEDIYLGEV